MNWRNLLIMGLAVVSTVMSCKPDEETIYNIEQQEIKHSQANKNNLKSDLEYISILYSDIFGKPITNTQLTTVTNVSLSFGDKSLINELLLLNLINQGGVQIPSDVEMKIDPDKFITDAFNQLLTRDPNEFEAFFINDLIKNDPDITAKGIFYAIFTSNEYRYY